MKKVMFMVLSALMMVGCASKKNAAKTTEFKTPSNKGDVEITMPCTGAEFQSDKKTFRATGEGFSNSMTIAKDKALQSARARLATSIEATIERVIDNYASSYESGMNEEAKSKYQEISRTIVKRKLQGTIPICEKMMKTPEGAFRSYVAIELGGPEVLREISNSISSDDKLRIDYEYEKFKKTFEEEMNKMSGK